VIAALIEVGGATDKLALFDNIFSLNQINSTTFVTLPQQYFDICPVSTNIIAGINGNIDIIDLQGNLLKRTAPAWGVNTPISISKIGSVFHCSMYGAPYTNWIVDMQGNVLNQYNSQSGNFGATRESAFGSQIFYTRYGGRQIFIAPDWFTSSYSEYTNIPPRPDAALYYCNILTYGDPDNMQITLSHRNIFPNVEVIKNIKFTTGTIHALAELE